MSDNEVFYEGESNNVEEKDVLLHKCPNCGSDMEYDSQKKKLVCNHCQSSQDVDGRRAEEIVFSIIPEENLADLAEKQHSFSCQNCGAVIILEDYAISGECPFCGGTSIMQEDEIQGLVPNGIIPFKLTKEQAKTHYTKWIKKKLFAPRKLKKSFNVNTMKGIYAPVFTFDSSVDSYYKGRLGERRTRTVTRNGKTTTETYIHWFNVSGRMASLFNDIVVEACDRITQDEINAILPYDTNNAKAFDTGYISGYTALRNETPLKDCWEVAKNHIDADIRRRIMAKYHADEVDYLNVDNYFDNTSYKYLLVPIWFSTYKFKSKIYRFLVNAVTGKTTGKFPLSPAKVSIAVFFGLLVLAGIAYLILKYNNII